MYRLRGLVRKLNYHFAKKKVKVDEEHQHALPEAIKVLKEAPKRKFDETVDILLKFKINLHYQIKCRSKAR